MEVMNAHGGGGRVSGADVMAQRVAFVSGKRWHLERDGLPSPDERSDPIQRQLLDYVKRYACFCNIFSSFPQRLFKCLSNLQPVGEEPVACACNCPRTTRPDSCVVLIYG